MLNETDTIVGLLLLLFLLTGWRKGFLRTIIGPFSTIIPLIVIYNYFNKIQNPLLCLGILILGPFVLTLLFSILLNLWHKNVEGGELLLWPSRLVGGTLSMLWGGAMILLVIIFIAIMPSKVFKLKKLQQNVTQSITYASIDQFLLNKLPLVEGFKNVLTVYQDPQKAQDLSSIPSFAEIYQDNRIQELLKDEDIIKLIKEKDVAKLILDSRIMELWQDKNFIQKMLKFNQESIHSNFEKKDSSSSLPKVYKLNDE